MIESPLAKIVRDQRIDRILESIALSVRSHRPIEIDPKDVLYIRRAFALALAQGEQKLHELAQNLLAPLAVATRLEFSLVVLGRCKHEKHEGMCKKVVSFENVSTLRRYLDALLASKHAPSCPICLEPTEAIGSFIRYTPKPIPESGMLELRSRIKSVSNIAFKIADMVFDIDFIFQRDKIRGPFKQKVADVYGIKIILQRKTQIPKCLNVVRSLPRTRVMEEKDYTGSNRKKSGFEVYKVVIERDHQMFEIQLQSEAMRVVEEKSQNASHRTYKERLMEDRKQLGSAYENVYNTLKRLFTSPRNDADPLL